MPEPKELRVAAWQHTCPSCGYENGFHMSFRRIAPEREGGEVAVWLICPSCSALFDVGMRVRLAPAARA